MEGIKERIQQIQDTLPENVTLVVVSKYHSIEDIQQAYDAGIRDFGENHLQELLPKVDALPKDIRWHFIGTLQRNKVKSLLPFIYMIQSVGSKKLYDEIERRAQKLNKSIDILIELHIAQEESKNGFTEEDAYTFFEELTKNNEITPKCRIRGIMAMATNTNDEVLIRNEFMLLKNIFQKVKNRYFKNVSHFDTLSCGMSNDWKIAVEEGSTLVRIGSAIMGPRDYKK